MTDRLGVAAIIVEMMVILGGVLGVPTARPMPLILLPVLGYAAWYATRKRHEEG